jgi:uncharacterized protein YegL
MLADFLHPFSGDSDMAAKRWGQAPQQTKVPADLVHQPLEDEAIDNDQELDTGEEFSEDSDELESASNLPAGIAVMIVVLLDVSGSLGLNAEKIREGVARLLDSLRREGTTKVSVDLLLLTSANEVKAFGFSVPANFECPKLQFGGQTYMGAAVGEAKVRIEDRLREYAEEGVSLNKCMVLAISDGKPTDDFEKSFADMRKFEAKFKRIEVFPVAVGDAAHEVLNQLSGVRQAVCLENFQFAKMFDWLFQSARIASTSKPGDQVDLPIPTWARTRKQ